MVRETNMPILIETFLDHSLYPSPCSRSYYASRFDSYVEVYGVEHDARRES